MSAWTVSTLGWFGNSCNSAATFSNLARRLPVMIMPDAPAVIHTFAAAYVIL